MSGSEVVRAYRDRKPRIVQETSSRWRAPAMAMGVAAALMGFGSIIVQATDGASVYAVAKQYNNARGTPRFQLPQIFQPSPRPVVRTSLSYAPSPQGFLPTAATGKRSVDGARRARQVAHRNLKGSPRSIKVSPSQRSADHEEFAEAFLSSRTSYCVRSCDGFFFPIGNPDSGSIAAHEAACARACPGAETAVYVAAAGSKGIDDAINRKGQRYQATVTAFNYRTQLASACSCNGEPGTPRNYSVMTDFTLRPGDLVMSREGLKVFRDRESFPHRARNFQRADTARMSAQERRWAQSTEASSMRSMSGARISPTLQARIAQQVQAAKGASRLSELGLRGTEKTIALGNGRQLRYVGPDLGGTVAR